MVRTFLDSGVLLAAARSLGRDRERALQILEDPDRSFLRGPGKPIYRTSLIRIVHLFD